MEQVDAMSMDELAEMAASRYGDFVKAVVDVSRRVMVVDGELHADEEAYLLAGGSQQKDLWGINLYPDDYGTDDFVEFDSLINIRPGQGNRTRGVDDGDTQDAIRAIVKEIVHG